MGAWKKVGTGLLAAALVAISAWPAAADLSVFVGTVGFDEEANLERSPAFGLRYGRSSSILGGEAAILIAQPERDLGLSNENATTIFYEGRFLINIPTGGQVSPFIGVGLGQIFVTSTDVPTDAASALSSLADTQTNSAFSYGGGVRYAVGDRLEVRFDIRQYLVFSVSGIAQDQLRQYGEEYAEQVAGEVGGEVAGGLLEEELKTKDNTVQYDEISVGINFRF
ncbi:MAG: outer membrane beta-barrel protein [Candidatus Latescibacteria bacterium]|nr:outer membrane beta-barrel protein [Candidatus Latescibacterota bacterium]